MPTNARRLRTGFTGSLLAVSASILGQAAPDAKASTSATPAWTLMPVAHYGTINGLSGLATSDVWAVGYFYDQPQARYRPLSEHWNGTTLRYIGAPTATRGYNAFNAVVEVAPNDVWAVGYHTPVYYTYDDSPLIEHYNGSKWSIIPSPYRGAGTLTDVAALGPNDVWAVGYRTVNPYGTLIEHWNGRRWSLLDDGHSADSSQFWSVVAKGRTTSGPAARPSPGPAMSSRSPSTGTDQRGPGPSPSPARSTTSSTPSPRTVPAGFGGWGGRPRDSATTRWASASMARSGR